MLPGLLVAASPAEPPAPKPHTLFMGVDLAVQREAKYHRVESVVGSELKIGIGKRKFYVPTRRTMTGLKVEHGLKLAHVQVKLDGLESGPSYTPANDPKHKFNRESGAAGGAAAVQDLAYGRMIDMNMQAGQTSMSTQGGMSGPAMAAAQAEASAMQDRANAAQQAAAAMSGQMQYSQQYDTGAAADRMHKELSEENYDAMEVSFKISSPVELDDPYMVILFRFRERELTSGEPSMLIHAKSLDPIGPKPKYIRVREGGLPVGFKFVDCTVHIYNRGQEVATNVSSKRVELTREEAQEYLVIEHIGTNKGATVPALAVPGTLLPARVRALSLDQLNRTYYAKVSKEGALLGVYADEVCHQPLQDPAVDLVLADGFFKPALLNGLPVDGVARLRLGEI